MSDLTHLTVTAETLVGLQGTTPESARKQRQGPGGKMLTYVDARYVMSFLDIEVGPGNWQDEYVIGPGGKVSCRIGIYVEDRGWVWKGDGAGETDIEGEKGSFSDAFKRAAVKWGIARDLYDEKPTTQGQPVVPAQVVPTAPAASPQPVAVSQNPVVPQAAEQAPATEQGGLCPAHGTPWTVKSAGTNKAGRDYRAFWKCDGRTNGTYCNEKPTLDWVKAHPAA